MTGVRRPSSTYRLQLTPSFGFREAAAIVPYLAELGVTDLYLSPVFSAAPGSEHGYDIVDHNQLRPELGGDEGYQLLCQAAAEHGMGQLLDVVPNHMGIARSRNRFWQDVLENGPSSRHARVFDIDWCPVKPEAGKVLLPILGDQYGAVLERQEIRLEYEDGAFVLRYFETTLPLSPRSVPADPAAPPRRDHRHARRRAPRPAGAPEHLTSLEHLPTRTDLEPERLAERQREKEIAKRRLGQLVASSAPIAAFLAENVRRFNGQPGDPASFDPLDELLGDQAYRLSHWRVASEEINYRRFFDINDLAAVRMDNPEVFEEAHRLVFALVADGSLSGLRIDHVDGLYDPGDYLRRLQARARDLAPADDLPLVVEKILAARRAAARRLAGRRHDRLRVRERGERPAGGRADGPGVRRDLRAVHRRAAVATPTSPTARRS